MTIRQARVAGHFGELLQGRIGPGGPLALVTLPCPALAVTAHLLPGTGLSVHGVGQRLLSPLRARTMLGQLGCRLSGRIVIRADMPAGGGAGASTASLVALARLSGANCSSLAVAEACIATEHASDPLMFEAPERLLWASRDGRILERLPTLPRLDVIGGFYGPPSRTDPKDEKFPDISDLIDPWRRAAQSGDSGAVSDLAATSAQRSLSLRGPRRDPTEQLASLAGAAGFAIAHTGSARALLFPPGGIPEDATKRLRHAGFSGIVTFRVGNQR